MFRLCRAHYVPPPVRLLWTVCHPLFARQCPPAPTIDASASVSASASVGIFLPHTAVQVQQARVLYVSALQPPPCVPECGTCSVYCPARGHCFCSCWWWLWGCASVDSALLLAFLPHLASPLAPRTTPSCPLPAHNRAAWGTAWASGMQQAPTAPGLPPRPCVPLCVAGHAIMLRTGWCQIYKAFGWRATVVVAWEVQLVAVQRHKVLGDVPTRRGRVIVRQSGGSVPGHWTQQPSGGLNQPWMRMSFLPLGTGNVIFFS